MRGRGTLLAGTLVLAGCTTFDLGTIYSRPGTTVAATSQDEWECRREVADVPHTPEFFIGGPIDAVRIVDEAQAREAFMNVCMRARGYEPSEREGWAKSLSLDSLRSFFRD